MSDIESLISYGELAHYIVPLGAMKTPSQLHGMLCGKLCGKVRLSAEEWLVESLAFLDVITDEQGVVGDDDGVMQAALARLYPVTLAQLEDSGYGFELLLPDDSAGTEAMASSLGEWCHGFLMGFAGAGLDAATTFSAETSECLKDLAAIAGIDEAVDDDDDAEADLMELVEYVRMAALTVFTECGQEGNPATRVLH